MDRLPVSLGRFVERWSRLKRRPAPARADLPPLETLAADADLVAYLGPQVEASLRRQALKRLFSDPCCNVMDGLDVYIGDYSIADPIPAQMLAQMRQVQDLLSTEDGGDETLHRPNGGASAAPDVAVGGPEEAA